ncbi:regulator of chromosome condensation 1/beta-lactamase-inhibitor protein II, partial [Mycena amicta]
NSNPDLMEPHILRSLANVKIVSCHTSGHSCHCVLLDIDGAAWLLGRNGSCALGLPSQTEYISEHEPKRLTPTELGAAPGTKFVHAACGRNFFSFTSLSFSFISNRNHTLLVGSDGQLWTAGINNLGQCGHPVSLEVPTFKSVAIVSRAGVKERVVQATAGITFSAVITASGKVFTFGSGEKGQLGNGKTGERIMTGNKLAFDVVDPTEVDGFDNKIIQISAGQQHCIALDATGLVYVWGYGGYCRLGLGTQADELRPKLVPNFAGNNDLLKAAFVCAGPSSSVVVDRQGMYWMTGKWKNTGEGNIGSSGSPYSSFRYMQDIMACKVSFAVSGGVTHWVITDDDDVEGQVMTVAWGQNAANCELGLGPEEPKSATKPTKHVPLIGVDVFDIGAGQNTTFFVVRSNNEKYADLPRHPVDVNPPETCIQCGVDHGDDGPEVLECEKCDAPYHLSCLTPPLESVPDGEWFCADCEENPGASVGAAATKLHAKTLKRKGEPPSSPGRK